jgi:hypothetical protein
MDRRRKVELFEQIRREYRLGVGTSRDVAKQLAVRRRIVRQALVSARFCYELRHRWDIRPYETADKEPQSAGHRLYLRWKTSGSIRHIDRRNFCRRAMYA